MANFVRTTGGLLQLQDKKVSTADYKRIIEFARTVGDAAVRSRVEQVPGSPVARVTSQVSSARKSEPVDLQADTPSVFR
jgi:hypothetical protein